MKIEGNEAYRGERAELVRNTSSEQVYGEEQDGDLSVPSENCEFAPGSLDTEIEVLDRAMESLFDHFRKPRSE